MLEAGYDLACSEATWVARLTESIARSLRGPVGTVGYLFSQQGRGYEFTSMHVVGNDSWLADATRHVCSKFPAADLQRFFTARGLTSSVHSCSHPMPADAFGMLDFCGLAVGDARRGLVIGSPQRCATQLGGLNLTTWRRISAHLDVILRLRTTLALAQGLTGEAVLTPEGRLLHAEGSARASAARSLLCRAVLDAEKARGPMRRKDPDGALSLWRELVMGRWTLLEKADVDGRRLIVAHANPPDAGQRALSERQNVILRLLVQGYSESAISSALGLSSGAISQQVRGALRKLRLRGPSALIELAGRLKAGAVLALQDIGGVGLCVVDGGPALAALLPVGLTRAERDIAALLVDGYTNADIARERGSSVRTVANQTASIYEKLNVSSRNELAFRARTHMQS